jgi:perosamine synthetase
MTAWPRFVPPAGTVLRGSDVASWLRHLAGGDREVARLEDAFRARYGRRHVYLVASARAGMTVLLRAMAELRAVRGAAAGPGPGARSEVAMPGYTCYSVAASAVRAGLRVRPIDVSPATLDFAPDALDATDLGASLALVGTSNYGIPSDLPRLERAARDQGAFLIDDAAQALDARVGARWTGTFGEAGLYSFDKGKNLTSIQGGAITCDDDALAALLDRACTALPAPSAASVATLGAKMLAYVVLLRPRLYWIANALLPLGETPFELDSPMTTLAPSLAPLVRRQLEDIERITAVRTANARRLADALGGVDGLVLPGASGRDAVYPRFPVVFEDPARRDRALRALVATGIGATGSYPRALVDVPAVQPHLAPGTADTPRARAVAAGILTLPTHAYVTARDIERIAHVIAGRTAGA